MSIQESISQLKQFRQEIYQAFEARADATMGLIDALSSDTSARSVAELSLRPCFRFSYSSLYDAIDTFYQADEAEKADGDRQRLEQKRIRLIASYLPGSPRRKFWLFALDGTPYSRPWAGTLEDRGYVYQPHVVRGNKPVTIGHQYSALVFLPEKTSVDDPPWVVPMSIRRVPTASKGTAVGAAQIGALMEDESLPFHTGLSVLVGDGAYSTVTFLGSVAQYENLVAVARVRSNRVFYHPYQSVEGKTGPGHPRWYGERFALSDPSTWGTPDEIASTTFTTRKGRTLQVCLEGWYDLLMRGKRDLPMHQHPFTLIRVRVLDEASKPVFHRPLWLMVFGRRRRELSLLDAREVYDQRFDEEHFFRFGKQRLLMTTYETPDVEHEENWMQMVPLAYVQLWLARDVAEAMPRPWERYLPEPKSKIASPSTVQRDFGRIIRQIGTPAQPPRPRGNSPGRPRGTRLEHRKRHPVIKKRQKTRKKASIPA